MSGHMMCKLAVQQDAKTIKRLRAEVRRLRQALRDVYGVADCCGCECQFMPDVKRMVQESLRRKVTR